jgi:hypothetical protein
LQSGNWRVLGSDLAVYIDQNSPIKRSMLEFHIVNIESAWPNTFEADRLQRAETGDQCLCVFNLWACYFRELGRELIEIRLLSLKVVDLAANCGLTARKRFLVLEPLRHSILEMFGRDIVDAFRVLFAAALMQDESGGMPLVVRLEGNPSVDDPVNEFIGALWVHCKTGLISGLYEQWLPSRVTVKTKVDVIS